jgi:hypothetical protein
MGSGHFRLWNKHYIMNIIKSIFVQLLSGIILGIIIIGGILFVLSTIGLFDSNDALENLLVSSIALIVVIVLFFTRKLIVKKFRLHENMSRELKDNRALLFVALIMGLILIPAAGKMGAFILLLMCSVFFIYFAVSGVIGLIRKKT